MSRDSLASQGGSAHFSPVKTLAHTADDLTGTFRTFGAEGPVYHVLRQIGGDKLRVCVVESGEELDYPVKQALVDPEAE